MHQVPHLQVVTFNCEWRRTRSADAALIRERCLADGPDVICLTETHSGFMEGVGHEVLASPITSYPANSTRRKVLLWSKRPWTEVDAAGPPGIPPGRFVAATTDTPLGPIRFVGVVIPYRFAGVRTGVPKRTDWELHLEYLAALEEVAKVAAERSVVVGDFNQRVPAKYQPKKIYSALEASVLKHLPLATGGVLQPAGRQAIDHICHSRDLACVIARSLSNARPGGGQISDHFGVLAEFRQAGQT
ncbi:endonuclease/exonuclease/phosphatase family protein [Sphingomonas kaistensis]|uniref:Endonuclease/exonuclease/phosphatase family protein n=1 Tax=Sphingomonas kaistensis TaxID=298708 RepID=A0ABZ2G124_9SPHN